MTGRWLNPGGRGLHKIVAKMLPRCRHDVAKMLPCDAHLDEGKNGGCPKTWGQVDPGAEVRREDQGGDHPHLGETEEE